MNECEETEEGVHPSETPLCGQHDNQTKAQSPEKQQIPDSQVLSKPMVHIQALSRSASLSPRPDFSESLFSHLLKDVATADRYSVLSSDSWLDSLESLSSYLKDSFQSSDSGCVSSRERTCSYHRNIDFKKNPDDKCAFRPVSLPPRLDSSDSSSSDSKKKVATADRYSVLSSDSGLDSLESLSSDLKKASFRSSDRRISLERKVSSGSSCESGKNWVDFSESPSSVSKTDVATDDGDSVLSSDSGVFVDRGSSETSCVSMKSDRSQGVIINFKGKKENTSSSTTQELVVGSSAGMETKSTHPPEAVQTSPPTTIQPADASTPPLPATRDKDKRKEMSEKLRRLHDKFRTYKNPLYKSSFRSALLSPRLNFGKSVLSHPLEKVATADRYSVLSSYSGLGSGESSSSDLKKDSFRSSDSRCVSRKEKARSYDIDIDFKKNPDHKCALRPVSLPTPPNFSESLFSHLLKKVATADGDSVLSLDSGLGSLESLSSDLKKDSFQSSDSRPDDKCSFRSASAPARLDSSESLFSHLLKDVATDDDDSVQSSHSGLGSGESSSSDLKKDSFRSSDSRCVSRKEKARSYDIDIDFKKNPDDKCAFRSVSLPTWLDFSEYLFSHPLKKVATADRYSVLSSDSGLDSGESSSSDSEDVATSDDDSVWSSHSRKPVMCIEGPLRAAASLSDLWNFAGSHFLYLKITFATADGDSFWSSDSGIYLERKVSSKYKRVSSKRMKPYNRIDSKKNPEKQQIPDSQVLSKPMVRIQALSRSASAPPWLDFSEYLFSHPLKKVATADRYSVLSSDSGLDSGESSSSDSEDVATSDDDSVWSSHSRKPVMCIEGPLRAAASLSDLWNFAGSHFLYLKITFATADGDSFWSSDSGIYLERKVSSKYKRVSSKRMKPYNRIDSKKNPEKQQIPDSQVFSKPMVRVQALSRSASLSRLDSLESLSSDLKKDSFRSSDSRCVSSKERTRSYQHDIDFKKKRPDFRDSSSSDSKKDAAADRYSVLSSDSWEKEKTAPPTTQELVVGSSSEIETKSTHLPEAV
ncbi:uncharacterized protein LOC122998243 [Thunnus albacares]|uniref:uncharacterized protein LOC122998243 n=1 Tax=Thunnus albacares TaxID=8236 RepID=UPI001CF6D8A3|nr:uncharacterized protein LOC122998243 [Thunnus albacares]